MKHILKTDNFEISMDLKIFESDITYPTNTIMKVVVQSDDFSAGTSMDIDIKEFAQFVSNLVNIYETLSGEATIEEPYGQKMYISFIGNGRGYISVKGYLHSSNNGYEQRLEFENDIDQTYLQNFCYELKNSYQKYLINVRKK